MTGPTITFIRCPGCETAVRVLDDTACLECKRCPFCGRKLEDHETHCGCEPAHNPQRMTWLLRDYGIPSDQVGAEVRRIEIRKQLTLKEAIVNASLGGVMLFAVGISFPGIMQETWWIKVGVACLCAMIQLVLINSSVNWVFAKFADRRLQLENAGSAGTRSIELPRHDETPSSASPSSVRVSEDHP